ncbi:MAG: class I SAM-dependent methyltransferase [Actinobacteria bacterium]|nr:class I SAM-dependent methyltransferase [Actinomycetota bacterium]
MDTRRKSLKGLEDIARRFGIRHQKQVWDERAWSWDHGDNPGLKKVLDKVVLMAAPQADMVAVDLGAGSGQLSIPLASTCKQVIAVDVSSTMIELLKANAAKAGLDNLDTRVVPIEELALEPESVDLVVSNYCMHHLRDEDKKATVQASYRWLKPGGRLVIGDMMFGRGSSPRDREIIIEKVLSLARKGPGGWWRITKNSLKFLARIQERPISMEGWLSLMKGAGFIELSAEEVVAEAAVVAGKKPS